MIREDVSAALDKVVEDSQRAQRRSTKECGDRCVASVAATKTCCQLCQVVTNQ